MNPRSLLFVLLLPFAGCLSSAPPLPPVRWFDPRPAAPAAAVLPPVVELRVAAAGHLGREFVVRTAARELVFDGQHGWVDEPAQLIAAALATRLDVRAGAGGAALAVQVSLSTFELDVQQEPRAVVRVVVHAGARRREFAADAAAADRSPAALAAAMAQALGQLAGDVADWVRGA